MHASLSPNTLIDIFAAFFLWKAWLSLGGGGAESSFAACFLQLVIPMQKGYEVWTD